MELLTASDFRIFGIEGFNERMAAIMLKVRPKLTSIGEELAPRLSHLVDRTLYAHVAKHARRTVHPPDDTWVAFGASPRGYKKDVHFKVAVSRRSVRFLFEAGPEYYAKVDWVRGWHREFDDVRRALRSAKSLAWFKDEHDEDPASLLKDLSPADVEKLADELTRRRDGQLVLGRRVDAADFVKLQPKQVVKIAADSFGPLAPLFQLHDARVLA